MKFSLIVCTYKRPGPIKNLLASVGKQVVYPNEIIIIDGSPDDITKNIFIENNYPNLNYWKVPEKEKGLTRQRNFGISKVGREIDIICFLDDDTVLKENYFAELLETYRRYPDAVGVGGYILEDVDWKRKSTALKNEFEIDGWVRKLGSRNVLRKKLGLLSDAPPGFMPDFSNGFSIGFLPPSGKIYKVEFFMGGVASYKRELFKKLVFSPYFEGYGLYEDMDFCLRASKCGQLYVNTKAQLYHHHESGGRPNHYKYGKMVMRNGWYVWRLKYPNPGLKGILKWHLTALTLTAVRIGNSINSRERKEAFTESMGRIAGWWSLAYNKPIVKR